MFNDKHGIDPEPPLRHQPLLVSQSRLAFFFSETKQIVHQACGPIFDVGRYLAIVEISDMSSLIPERLLLPMIMPVNE